MLYILSDQFPVKDASFENLLFLFKYLMMLPILNLGDLLMTRFVMFFLYLLRCLFHRSLSISLDNLLD